MTPHVLEKDREVKEEVTWKTYDVAEYNRLSASFDDPKTMKWKLVPKPGGQAIKTDDYYTLQACIKQVEEGDAPRGPRSDDALAPPCAQERQSLAEARAVAPAHPPGGA